MSPSLSSVVLAAGQGTRMRSDLPKPLHRAAGRSILHWVLAALRGCETSNNVVVVGHGSEEVIKRVTAEVDDMPIEFVHQLTQRGTGDATSVGLTGLPDDLDEASDVLVLPGDTPLLRAETLAAFVAEHRARNSVCTVLTANVDDATGYGRIVRGPDGDVTRIVEHADATDAERAITEFNTGIFCFRRALLAPALRRVQPDNAQGEFYLTDVVEVLRATGHPVHAHVADDAVEMSGVNDRAQLAAVETELRRRINAEWMRRGVSMIDPASTYVDVTVSLGTNVTLHPGTVLRGDTVIGDNAEVGPATTLTDCAIGRDAVVTHTVGVDAEVAPAAVVGPFAVIGADADDAS